MIKSSDKSAENSISPVISKSSTKAKNFKNDSPQILDCLKEISNNVNTLICLLEGSPCNPINSASKNTNSPIENEINDMMKYVDSILEKHKKDKSILIDSSEIKESTLIISETTNTVTLPYTLAKLNAILYAEKSPYENYNQIIQDLYTIPLSNYKNFSLSRFREAFNLVRKKEHGSIKSAIELGIEVFANYNLHPAIITACNNLNEFDVYLSCMEYNELEDFHFFKVEFESVPSLITNKFKLLKKFNRSSKNTIDLM